MRKGASKYRLYNYLTAAAQPALNYPPVLSNMEKNSSNAFAVPCHMFYLDMNTLRNPKKW